MTVAVVGILILLAIVGMVVAFALEPGPPPDEVATAYELAWDRLDFATIWTLSGPELRDGLPRERFVAAKQAAYAQQSGLGNLARHVAVTDAAAGKAYALVHTRVDLRDGGSVHNELQLARRGGRWEVVSYRLRADAPPAHP